MFLLNANSNNSVRRNVRINVAFTVFDEPINFWMSFLDRNVRQTT